MNDNDAEKRLGVFGLSHNAEGKVDRIDGEDVVTEIYAVRSVDLVTDPATNRNLWESRRMTTTLKRLIEENRANKPKTRKALLEIGPDMGAPYTAPMEDAPPPAADPAAAVAAPPEENARDMLAKGLMMLLKSGDNSDHKLAIGLMKLLKPQGSGSAMGTPPGDVAELDEDDGEEAVIPEVEGEDDDEEDDMPPVKESKKSRKPVGAVLTEADAKGLAELAGVKATPALLTLMTGKPLTEARAALEVAKGGAAGKGNANAPRSVGVGGRPLTEARASCATAADQAKLLFS